MSEEFTVEARKLKQSEVQLSTFCVQLKLTSSDGKAYKTDCVNTEAAFRVIQSIPSPKPYHAARDWHHREYGGSNRNI